MSETKSERKNLITPRWVIRSMHINPTAKLIYMVLRTDSFDKNGYSVTRASVNSIKKKTGIKSDITISKALDALVEKTFIKRAPKVPDTYFVAHWGPWDISFKESDQEDDNTHDISTLVPDSIPGVSASANATDTHQDIFADEPPYVSSDEAFKKYLEEKKTISFNEIATLYKKYRGTRAGSYISCIFDKVSSHINKTDISKDTQIPVGGSK